ncbi:MAG: phosphatidate cytidylyltransferase, partial [Chloroflexota bacterium]|nr:phosphatidate cytidylyltransferase [Chloroflexota bacterium]
AFCLAGYEFFQMMTAGGYKPSHVLGLALIVLLLADARYPSRQLIRPAVSAILVLSLLWQIFQKHTLTPAVDWALTVAGGLYLGWVGGFFISLRDAAQGMSWLALVFLPTWACDTAAYFVGLSLGRHKLLPRISPGKSWEGTVGGWLAGLALTLLVGRFIGLNLIHSLALGALVGIAAPLGDLAISMMKRQVGVKDSSHLIPGHGGMLDRIDSLLFVVVVVYCYAFWLGSI